MHAPSTVRRFTVVFSVLLLLSGCASQPPRGPALTGEEVHALLAGNTLEGNFAASPFRFFFEPGGTVRGTMGIGLNAPGPDSGTWSVEGDLYCQRWTVLFNGDRRCYRVHPSGEQFFFDNADAFRTFGFTARMIPGRPQGQW